MRETSVERGSPVLESFYFLYIPKTGGTSVNRFLDERFAKDAICPWHFWDHIVGVPKEHLTPYQLYRGHFSRYLEPYLGKPLTTFTILRDPLERTISHYFGVRRSPEHPSYGHACSMSLYEFCTDRETRHNVVNYQARYLVSFDCNPASPRQSLKPEHHTIRHMQMHVAMERGTSDLTHDDSLFDLALEALDRFVAVGITERLDETLHLLSRVLQRAPPTATPRANAGENRIGREPPDLRTIEKIQELTMVDRRLYEIAVERLESQLSPPVRE